jgi:hypothetical protein
VSNSHRSFRSVSCLLTATFFYDFQNEFKTAPSPAGRIKETSMKQKFIIQKNDDDRQLIVQEYAELDKDILSFICEERHDLARIESALKSGREALIAELRTDNMYPPILYAQAIADVIIQKLTDEERREHEVVFDDDSYIRKDQRRGGEREDADEEDSDLEDLLDEDLDDEDLDDEYDDKKLMKNFKSSIKIADDDSLDVDDDG